MTREALYPDGKALSPTELDRLIAYVAQHPDSSLTVEVHPR